MPVTRKAASSKRRRSAARRSPARMAAAQKLLARTPALKRLREARGRAIARPRPAAPARAGAAAKRRKPVVFNSPLEPKHTTRAAIAETVSRFVS